MRYTSFIPALLICTVALNACAQAKKTTTVKSATAYAKVIEATRQRTLPGARGSQPVDEYRLLIVWKSTTKPESFFWRGASGWMPCEVAKAHKHTQPQAGERWYTVEEISTAKIKKGDTLELLPVAGGKFPIPSQIPSSAVNTIFLKTQKTSWLSLPVKNLKKADDVIMP